MTSKKKSTGSYYTPTFLSTFIMSHVVSAVQATTISVLEPSVGDGEFIRAFKDIPSSDLSIKTSFTCLEKVKPELLKAAAEGRVTSGEKVSFKFRHTDFLKWQYRKRSQFSLVVGNPPYIKKNLLSDFQIAKCKSIHNDAGLPEYTVKNIWTSFLIRSIQLLKRDGILALVLPAELLQAKFAKPIRKYVTDNFERLEIFTFEELLFDSIGQDTIILFGYKKSNNKGVFYANIKDKGQLTNKSYKLRKNDLLIKSDIKWIHHTLSGDEIEFLTKLKGKLNTIDAYCTSKPGIVTAANDYFIVNSETEKKFKLKSFSEPIIQKGIYVNGSVNFDKRDLRKLETAGHPSKFLHFEERAQKSYSKSIQNYFKSGVQAGIHNRYKCLQRDYWFVVPNLSPPSEAFFFKRCHQYPKLLRNSANVLVTDSAYQVDMLEGTSIESLIYSFYNSLSLCFAEMEGRYYGGGVLELTPSEFKKIPIPIVHINKKSFQEYKSLFEQKSSIDDILLNFDSKILGPILKTDSSDILKIRAIKNKLLYKRLRK